MYKFSKKKKQPLPLSLVKIRNDLQQKCKQPIPKINLTREEVLLVQKIKDDTNELNLNNVTRTMAYLDFFNRYPEIHWAFLGHMVSRNGGWNMTDLKGSLLSRILTEQEAVSFFTFLERGNWLIFQDAFPQFLVYEECIKRGENLFYLLPYFHVSTFMETCWNQFWEQQNPYILAIAQVVNEQTYLESRVLANPAFKKEVLNKIEFKLQDLLSLNHILFPYLENGKTKLFGQTLHHFESLHERILLGKRLYALLFGNPTRLKMTVKWANETPHSGSRKDFWPHIFNDVDEGIPGRLLKPRLKSGKLLPGSPRFYSPRLDFAWKNSTQDRAEMHDWFKDWKTVYYLTDLDEFVDGEIEYDYCKTLERIELAAIAKKAISFFD